MNTLIRNLRVIVCVTAIFALPQFAWAIRGFATFSISPTSISVPAGTATNVSGVETVVNGSGGSTRYIGPATLSTTVSPAEPTLVVSVNPPVLTFPAATTTLMSTVSVATATSTPIGSYVVSIVINTNPANAAVTPSTNTFTVNVGSVFVPTKTWNPAGANTNWSTAANWLTPGVPVSSNDLVFVDAGAVGAAGTVDNLVDVSQTIGSLTYGQTNGFHTTLIGSGLSLTVGATANGLSVGTGSDIGDGQLTTAAITGAGGALSVTNRNAILAITQAHTTTLNVVASAQATLDLSGLDQFTATVARVLVGVDSVPALKGASGVLKLARTNSISVTAGSAAPQIDVGDNTQANGSQAIPSVLLLGQTNAIFADSISVGSGKTDTTGSSMSFNSAFASPIACFRGTNGSASRVGTWTVGDAASGKSSFAIGTCDFSLGTIDALLNTAFVGKGGANDPGTGTLTLGGGTMDVNTMEVGYSSPVGGTGTLNVNGGTLQVNALFELGHAAGSSGTLNLSGGAVVSSVGIASAGGTSAINMTGGTLTATNSGANIGTLAAPINTLLVANGILNLAAGKLGAVIEAGTLNGGGLANTINIRSIPALTNVPAQFPIIHYTTPAGDLSTFTLGTLPGVYQGYISNNTGNSSIDLVVTNGPVFPLMVWDGAQNGNWDVGTLNWKTNGVLAAFQPNYPSVQFDDSLTGTTNVNLTTALSPGTVTVNNSLSDYVFTGAGNLGGTLTLAKSGSGALTLAESGGDNFSGGIVVSSGTVILDGANESITGGSTINGGTLQIGKNDANGSLPAGGIALAGTMAFNRVNNLTVTNLISGSGTIAQDGSGMVTLAGNNSTFAGTAVVNQSTLQVGSTNGIGMAGSVTVSNGTFDVNGFALFSNGNSGLNVNVQGAGVGGNGAIINSGASATRVLHTVTLIGDATFGGTGDWDIRNSTGSSTSADAALNGAFNLTKVGTNSVSLRGVTVDGGLGNISVQGGTLTFTATASAPQNSLGDPGATIMVLTNATLTLDTIGNIPTKNIVLTNGGTFKSSGTNVFSSQLTLTGAANNTISVGTGAQLTITTPIIGPGGLSKNGSSTLFLMASNTYTGNTVVSGGTLALYGGGSDGAIASSATINVTSGAILDVSGRSDQTLTVANGQTLSGGAGTNGPGVINGLVNISASGIFAPGIAPTNTGAVSISSNLTLAGASVMKLNAQAGTNDQASAFNISYGGALTITNYAGTLAAGNSFQLFAATNYSNSFTITNLPALAGGLTWSNSLAIDGRITVVAASGPSVPPYITSINLSGTSLVINGTNGSAGQQFTVFSSTNLILPLASWTPVSTNTFSGGNFSVTNTLSTIAPQNFFIIRLP